MNTAPPKSPTGGYASNPDLTRQVDFFLGQVNGSQNSQKSPRQGSKLSLSDRSNQQKMFKTIRVQGEKNTVQSHSKRAKLALCSDKSHNSLPVSDSWFELKGVAGQNNRLGNHDQIIVQQIPKDEKILLPETQVEALSHKESNLQEEIAQKKETPSEFIQIDTVMRPAESNIMEIPTEILILRGQFPQIVMNKNLDEDKWACDICLWTEDENDEDLDENDRLAICELCLLVVHPSCYRRDLFDQDPDDDSPWYCSRCQYLIYATQEHQLSTKNTLAFGADFGRQKQNLQLPNCLLCNDYQGAMVDLESNEWVHHTCVNWHTEIWFAADDKYLKSFEGALDYSKFEHTCYICKSNQGSCIECDSKGCKKHFHVRCAIQQKLIQSGQNKKNRKKESEYDLPNIVRLLLDLTPKKVCVITTFHHDAYVRFR